ncbi:cytochrome P450 4c3-like [Argiope bruennichi]|nr:cytochrome P450 4c3-like [Argiope bruennichi]
MEGFKIDFNFTIVFSIVFIFTVLWYFFKVYLPRRHMVQHANLLPSMKLKFYHVLGHVSLVWAQRRWKKKLNGYNPHVYDFIALTGFNKVFSKNGISNIWQIHYPFVSVFQADAVEAILNHSTELKKAWFYDLLHPFIGHGLLTSYDEKWRKKRKMLTPAFHFNILKDFLHAFNKQSKILVDILKSYTKDEFTDIVPVITKCSLDIICEAILGKEVHSQTQPSSSYVKAVVYLTDSVFERMQSPWYWNDFLFKISPFGRKFMKNVDIVHSFTRQVISEKKAELEKRKSGETLTDGNNEVEGAKRKKLALMDLLLEEHCKHNSISEEEIREEVDTFTFEGHDTTSSGISWCLWMIGLHPWIQKKIHEELDSIFGDNNRDATMEDLKDMKYLECVIKEALRLYPPVPAIGRMLRNDLQIGEFLLPRGSMCLVIAYLLHRDPEFFPNPEKFDPDRFSPENSAGRHPFAYVPFSAGPRNCIGQRFALMEEKTVLSSILRKFKVRSLDPRDKVQLLDEIVLRPYKGLRIQIRERSQPFDFHSVYYFS